MLKHYVTFFYPGSFFANESNEEIKSREQKLKIPKNAYAYSFWDIEETTVNGEVLKGNAKNRSGLFYFGTALTLEEVKSQHSDKKILISNMESNKWDKVVLTRAGNFQPLNADDKIMPDTNSNAGNQT